MFVRRRLLTPMQYQVGGTILGGIVAVKTGYAINIGGGFHHASAYSGGGFCVYVRRACFLFLLNVDMFRLILRSAFNIYANTCLMM